MSDLPIPGAPQINKGRFFLNALTMLFFALLGLTVLIAMFSILYSSFCLFSAISNFLVCIYNSTSLSKGQPENAVFLRKNM
jgi:hypothetical protein